MHFSPQDFADHQQTTTTTLSETQRVVPKDLDIFKNFSHV